MKKIYFTFIALITISLYSYAQTNTFPPNGNVGIGTITPTYPLDIEFNSNATEGLILNNTSTGSSARTRFAMENGSVTAIFNLNGSNYPTDPNLLDIYAPSDMSFGVVGTEIMRIKSSGYIGILTSTPTDQLDVKGNPVFGTLTERLSMGSGLLGFNRRVATGAIYDNTKYAYQFTHTGSTTNTADYLSMQVYNPSGTIITPAALCFNGLGQVGINTTTTDGYQLAINGTAIANSMTVKLYANWPDYVFNKDYQLPTLNFIKIYIDQNHHLPEMPTDEQIAKDGLNLGEMNKLLVKKVEEVTLYLIDKDKEIKSEQDMNKEQETELNTQKLINQSQDEQLKDQQKQLSLQQAQIDKLNKVVEELAKKQIVKN